MCAEQRVQTAPTLGAEGRGCTTGSVTMLVLTRTTKDGENEIILDRNIVIRVVRVRGNAVRLGIEAPQDVQVRRGELTQDQEASE